MNQNTLLALIIVAGIVAIVITCSIESILVKREERLAEEAKAKQDWEYRPKE